MLSKLYPHPEERPKRARLEGRKPAVQPFVPILAQPRNATRDPFSRPPRWVTPGFRRTSPLYALKVQDGAQPGAHPPRDARAFDGRDLAARNRCQNRGQRLLDILGLSQRYEVDPETLRRVDLGQRRRQYLRRERPQQMRLASSKSDNACALGRRAARSGMRRLGLRMPRGRPRGLPELPFANRPRSSRPRGEKGSGPSS
jgi:hypothetical protein